MRNILLSVAIATTCFGLAPAVVLADDLPAGAVKTRPDELKWNPSPRVAGLENANILGDSSKPGEYVIRTRFPANFQVKPHSHPENRSYTVISGTWHIGWGKTFDAGKLIALPPGSFYTEPAGVPHFVATRDEAVVVQISGMGPTAVHYVEAAK